MRSRLYPHPLRRHRWDPRKGFTPPPGPPGPAVAHVSVYHVDANRFCWVFDQPFDDSGSGGWIVDDFASLTVDGANPDGIDEVVGPDGTLTLTYALDHADTFHALDTPAVLKFANGATVLVPDSGPVTP